MVTVSAYLGNARPSRAATQPWPFLASLGHETDTIADLNILHIFTHIVVV